MKSKRSKATDISRKVKETVWERDGHRCIFCGSPQAMPNAHYIPRSHGGLGVEENIVTACMFCHDRMDHTTERPLFLKAARDYLAARYKGWNEDTLVFKKGV